MLTRITRLVLVRPRLLPHCIPAIASIRHYANIDKKNPTRKRAFKLLDDELKTLHMWISRLTVDSMPKDLCKVSFSRASGPGGQNVNKLNTKATIRLNLYEVEDKLNWPHIVIDALRGHRDTTKEGDIIVSSQRFQTQTQNLQDAWEKLFTFVKNIVELPGYTSLASEERKEKLKEKEKAHVREWKTKRSEKKQFRQGKLKDNDDW